MVNEISNMSFITQQSNMDILDKDPALYLPEIPVEQLRKQFVPTDPQYYTIERYEEFLEERRKLLCAGLNKFLDKYYINPEKSAIPEDLSNYNDDIETIEFALRDLIDQKLNEAAEEDPYIEFISQHIREKVDGRLLNWLMKNPGEDSTQFKNIRRKLDFFDLQEYKDIIVSKPVWQVFESNFGSKSVLENRFNQLAELRNSIRHSRDITEATLKDGEAAISWFNSVLRSIIKPNQLIIQD
jgi:hypothetical protein